MTYKNARRDEGRAQRARALRRRGQGAIELKNCGDAKGVISRPIIATPLVLEIESVPSSGWRNRLRSARLMFFLNVDPRSRDSLRFQLPTLRRKISVDRFFNIIRYQAYRCHRHAEASCQNRLRERAVAPHGKPAPTAAILTAVSRNGY